MDKDSCLLLCLDVFSGEVSFQYEAVLRLVFSKGVLSSVSWKVSLSLVAVAIMSRLN